LIFALTILRDLPAHELFRRMDLSVIWKFGK